eukprot:8860106-Karenia_brevis.AAC.1
MVCGSACVKYDVGRFLNSHVGHVLPSGYNTYTLTNVMHTLQTPVTYDGSSKILEVTNAHGIELPRLDTIDGSQ